VNGRGDTSGATDPRKRVAVEMIAQHEAALRRTARRYSICAADADDAYQRALEILLVKAPPGEARELVRWMQTVTKHEALAIRRGRERQLSPPPPPGISPEESVDWLSLIPSRGDGPAEKAERREDIARSREALKTLKPAELKALTLLAEGYSYSEIGEMTGFSRTKVNRCLAEGRERFRAFLTRSESGGRCLELRPVLSAFCDGEASPEEAASLREHLRVCGYCRASMRAYRAAPGAAAALLPAPLIARSLLERAHEALASLQARLTGRAVGLRQGSVAQVTAAGGVRGAGTAALAKGLAVCAGTVGSAAACVATGVIPIPPGLAADQALRPHIERLAEAYPGPKPAVETEPRSTSRADRPADGAEQPPKGAPQPSPQPASEPAPEPVTESPEPAAVEYETPAPSPAPSSPEAAPAANGSPAGEFGP
jgi:RNA polymerase sigma factor (sigma-70 family)